MTHPTTVDPSTSRPLTPAAGVVLGFGAALDCEIRWDAAVVGDLATAYDIAPEELVGQVPIRSERDLVVSVLGYLARSAGGERRVDEPTVIEEFSARFDRRASIGGTCVRAAAAMLRLGHRSTVHLAFESDQVRGLLPPGTQTLAPDVDLPSYPHLIVQYPAGARVVTDRLDLVTTRANRLIYVNDPANEQIELSPDLASAVAGSDVFLVSGFNAMRDLDALRARLDVVESAVQARRALGTEGVVMYEDAGFHEPRFADVVRLRMAALVDVYSLSDEELLEASGGSGSLDLLDADAVLAAVSALAVRLEVPVVVVHSRHWALAFGARASRYRDALASGTALATARYAHGELVTDEDVATVVGTVAAPEVVGFVERLHELAQERVAVVAVPTLDVPSPTTVGLGDTFVGGFLAACVSLADDPDRTAPSLPAGKAP